MWKCVGLSPKQFSYWSRTCASAAYFPQTFTQFVAAAAAAAAAAAVAAAAVEEEAGVSAAVAAVGEEKEEPVASVVVSVRGQVCSSAMEMHN